MSIRFEIRVIHSMDKKINEEIQKYIEGEILPIYSCYEKAHNIEHIKNVINRSLNIAKDYNVDINMVYVIAAFHDIGHKFDRKNHSIISGKILFDTVMLKKWFDNKQIKIMKEAVEDHSAHLSRKPRSIYGEIVSDADRSIDIDSSLRRAYQYDIKYFPERSLNEHIDSCYEHMKSKYGKNGYLKLWLKTRENIKAYNEHRMLADNKEMYVKRFKKVNNIE